ncbi:MAG: hypothetical protein ONB06_05440, partial [candidate division KSB1 bacterium]|nr:hypothetical protein [candidate division KSB1 bacterium]
MRFNLPGQSDASVSPRRLLSGLGPFLALFLVFGVLSIQIAGIAMQGKFFPYHYGASLLLIGFVAGLGLYKLWRRCLVGGAGGVVTFASFVVVAVVMRDAARDLPQRFWERAWIRTQS